MWIRLCIVLVVFCQFVPDGSEARPNRVNMSRRKKYTIVKITIRSSDCQKPVQGVKIACSSGSEQIKTRSTEAGVYMLKTSRLPKTIQITKDGFSTLNYTIRTCLENVTLNCAGEVCSTETVTVTVSSDCTAFVQNVVMTSPDIKAFTSPSPGVYQLSVCTLPVTVEFSRYLFVKQSKTFSSNTGTVELICRRNPFMVDHPQSKRRALGEDAKLCCWADTLQPGELAFTWYFDGIEIPGENDMNLLITNIVAGDEGKYKCKASMTMDGFTQAVMSEEATLTIVADSMDHQVELQERLVTLNGGCQADVGFCRPVACRTAGASDLDCIDDGYVCPVAVINETVDCGPDFGIFNIEKITSCGCCTRPMIIVHGVVTTFSTGLPISGGTVTIFRVEAGSTASDGKFTATVKPEVRRIVIRVVKDGYLDAIAVIRVPAGYFGEVDANIVMFKRANPITINSNQDNTLSISQNPSDPNIGIATIHIPKDSFYNTDGTLYTGTVKAYVTAITADNKDAIRNAPGEFLTIDENGEDNYLVTQGVLQVAFEDANGNRLRSRPLKVIGDESMFLWSLNKNTGTWVRVNPSGGRRKRGVVLGELGEITPDPNSDEIDFYNIDKFPQNKTCWIKTRIFDDTDVNNIIEIVAIDLLTTYRPGIEIFTTSMPIEYLPLTYYSTTSPSTKCFEVRCDVDPVVDPDTLGTIGIKVFFFNINAIAIPFELGNYPQAIQNEFNGYLINSNNEIETKFYSSPFGPFYENEQVCMASTVTDNHFRFKWKPPVLSDPYEGSDERCVARVKFTGDNVFINYMDVNTPVLGEAASIWDVNQFIMTQAPSFTSQGTSRIYCIEYRCSRVDSSTTVSFGKPIGLGFICSNGTFFPPILPGSGYYQNLNADEGAAITECEANGSAEFAWTITCEGLTPQ